MFCISLPLASIKLFYKKAWQKIFRAVGNLDCASLVARAPENSASQGENH
ncbi:hypothetical protein [Phascolarctobacterium sp.]